MKYNCTASLGTTFHENLHIYLLLPLMMVFIIRGKFSSRKFYKIIMSCSPHEVYKQEKQYADYYVKIDTEYQKK